MFQLKFINYIHNEDGDDQYIEHSLECNHYSVYKHKNGSFAVTLYEGYSHTNGVEWTVGIPDTEYKGSRQFFSHCYITNSKGITVETLRAKV